MFSEWFTCKLFSCKPMKLIQFAKEGSIDFIFKVTLKKHVNINQAMLTFQLNWISEVKYFF